MCRRLQGVVVAVFASLCLQLWTVVHSFSSLGAQLIGGTLSAGITALALTSNRRLLAVAEAGLADKSCAVVNIYDTASLKRRKMLALPDLDSLTIANIAFSGDGRFCLTLGGSPDWKLVLWTAERATKIICSAKMSTLGSNGDPAPAVSQADFCPCDSSIICVSGDKILRFFRVTDGQFKPTPSNVKMELHLYTSHCWPADDQVVVSTEQGELYLFENLEFRCFLQTSPTDGNTICNLVAFSRGFVSGGANGMLRVYEKSEDPKEFYRCLKVFHIEGNESSITNLAISPSEDNLALTTSNNQMYSLALSSSDILKEDTMNFDRLAGPFPSPTTDVRPGTGGVAGTGSGDGNSLSARINDISCAVWKPLVATVSMDGSLRLWNFHDKSSEMVKFLDEVPLAVSLHPSGLYVLIAFGERVRLYSILMDDLRQIKEFAVKHCRVACFSGGGQYLAFANNAQVLVHETYTCDLVNPLKGHQGKIRSIVWKNRDRQILTASSEGQLYIWEVCTGRRLPDTYQGRCAINAASATGDFSRQFCVGEDMQIRELNLTKTSQDGRIGVKAIVATDVAIGTLQVAETVRMLFAGTAQPGIPGYIRAYPIGQGNAGAVTNGGGSELRMEFQEYGCLSLAVSCMVLNHDGSLLFVGGEDGVLAMYSVADDPKAAEKKARERDAVEYMEEILVTRADMKEQSKQMQSLKNAVDELMLNNEYQLRLKDMNYKEKTRELTETFMAEVEMDRRSYQELQEERKNMEVAYDERIARLRAQHAEEKSALETQHKTMVSGEVDRYQSMVQEKEALCRMWDEKNQALVDAQGEELKEVMEEYDRKVKEEHAQQRELAEEKEKTTTAFSNMKQLIEDDADREAEYVKNKFAAKLTAEREATLRLKGENALMKKKFSQLSKQVEDQKEETKRLEERQRGLAETIKSLEKDIQGHKKEIREREETIADKESRIYDLKKKNQELEKFKFVLDYKIKELKRQIQPREKEISDLKGQIEEMDLELEQYHKSNSALDVMIGELRLKAEGMQKEVKAQGEKLEEGDTFNRHFRADLRAAVEGIFNMDDHRALKRAVILLYRRYDKKNPCTGKRGERRDLQHEYKRQRGHLERSMEALKNSIDKDLRLFERDQWRLNRENVVLTGEINELRKKAKALALVQHGVEQAMAGDPTVDITLVLGDSARAAPQEAEPVKGPARLTGFDGTRRPQAASKASGSKASKAGGTTANKGCHSVGSMNPGIDQFAMSSNATENNDVEGDIDMDMEDVEHQGQGQEQGQDEQTRRLWKEVEIQQEQVRQLERHAAKLKASLEAKGFLGAGVAVNTVGSLSPAAGSESAGIVGNSEPESGDPSKQAETKGSCGDVS